MSEHISIRRAVPEDAEACAPLILASGPELFAYMMGSGADRLLDIIRRLFVVPRHAFGYDRAEVASVGDEVVGCLVAYPGSQERSLDARAGAASLHTLTLRELAHALYRMPGFANLVPRLEPSDYYIQNLAVTEKMRGHGIGTRLLTWAEEEATRTGCDRLAIDVVEENPRARALYERLGFCLLHTTYTRGRLRRDTGITASHRLVKPLAL
jgi:ribosomal protein S18 acetylase RimI-like enzyme